MRQTIASTPCPARYALIDPANGIDEDEPLDLSMPYAYSKGTGGVYATPDLAP